MKTAKTSKRALLCSVLSIALCLSMLIGTTFAWFTDTASTSVNKIQAGKLDVALEMKNPNFGVNGAEDSDKEWVTAEGKTLNFVKAEGHEDEEVLWEPGATYQLPELRVVNNGNLALKYKVTVTGAKDANAENGKDDLILMNVLDWTYSISGNGGDAVSVLGTERRLAAKVGDTVASDTLTIKAKMQESAGNDYQGLAIEGIAITVVATQNTVEYDSTNNTYDEKAEYPKIVTDAASIADAVAELATAGNKNVVVKVANNLTGTSGIVTAKGNTFELNMNGNTVGVNYGQGSTNTTTNGMQLKQGSTVTLKNGTYAAEHGDNKDHNIAILVQNYSNLTIDSCILDMRKANDPSGNSKGTSYVLSSNCGNVTIKGNTNLYARSGDYALDVMHWENASYKDEGTHVVFEDSMTGIVDGKIDVYCYRGSSIVKPVDDGGATLVIKGGTFKNSGLTLEQFKAFVPAGYTVTTNADGSYTVSK